MSLISRLPDAFVVATALEARRHDADVRVESFDERVLTAYERLARS
jgi:hypothetical protein